MTASDGLRFDLARLTRICVGLVWLSIIAEIAYAYDAWSLRAYLDATAARVDSQGFAIGIAYSVIIVITSIVCCIWIYRASWNARQRQPSEDRVTPGWAVGWFFVPIMSLWKPYRAMTATWGASHVPEEGLGKGSVPAFVPLWWGLWVVASLMSNYSFRMSMKTEYTEDFRAISTIDLICAPLAVLAALLFIRLMTSISAAQRDKVPGVAPVFA